MKHTQEEILNALRVIKETCEECEECEVCPFRGENNGPCDITDYTPKAWKICDSDNWRAFL